MVPNSAQLSFVCQFITLSPPDPALQKLINQFVVPSFSSFGAIDLTTLFQTLGTDVPQNTEFARFGGSVIIRFDPNSPPSDHLINGLQWGIFIPSSVLETLVDNLIGTAAGTQLQENGFSVGNPITTYMGSQTGNAYLEATLSGTKPDSCLGENFSDRSVRLQDQHVPLEPRASQEPAVGQNGLVQLEPLLQCGIRSIWFCRKRARGTSRSVYGKLQRFHRRGNSSRLTRHELLYSQLRDPL